MLLLLLLERDRLLEFLGLGDLFGEFLGFSFPTESTTIKDPRLRFDADGKEKVLFKQAREPRSYASSKLSLADQRVTDRE